MKPNDAPVAPKVPARDRLIEAASALFAEKGFGSVSVREICKAAGTSINMVHHYFGSKDGLRDAIFERYDQNVYVVPMRLLQNPAASAEDLAARLLLVFETTLEACLAERAVLMVVLREQAELDTLQAFQARFVSFLEEAKAAGYVRQDLDCAMISGAMLDRILSQAQFAPWMLKTAGIDVQNDTEYRRRWCAANLDLFLNGIVPRD